MILLWGDLAWTRAGIRGRVIRILWRTPGRLRLAVILTLTDLPERADR